MKGWMKEKERKNQGGFTQKNDRVYSLVIFFFFFILRKNGGLYMGCLKRGQKKRQLHFKNYEKRVSIVI